MLSLDPVHQNSGGVAAATSSAPVTVALAGGETTETGNTLLVFVAGGNGQQVVVPAGWYAFGGLTTASDASGGVILRGPAQGLVAGESSWDFTPVNVAAGPVRWTVLEVQGIATNASVPSIVYDVISNGGACTTVVTGTTAGVDAPMSSVYDGLAMSFHYSYNPSGTDTWTGHTDGFTEIAGGSQAGTGSDAITLSVSGLPVQRIGTYGSTATCSRTLNGTNAGYTFSFVLIADGSRRAANIMQLDGAEHGLITGNALGPTGFKLLETVTAGVSVTTAAKRSGNYGWQLSSTSAACNYTMHNTTSWSSGYGVQRWHFKFPTLPAVDTVMTVLTSGTVTFTLRFITATSKLGMQISGGSEQVSDQTITANQWFGIDIQAFPSGVSIDWSVDYNAELTDTTPGVPQTRATGTGSAGSVTRQTGWTNAITATMYTDDNVAAGLSWFYPLGDVRVLPAKVDPAGTVVLSGTSTNFGVMTGNGTVGAWNATNARNAVDDIPPDLSGTRDAAVCIAAHASDYIEFPVETVDMAALGVTVRGARFIACIWAASATTATMRLSVWENGNQITGAGMSERDPGADNTATPVWVTGPLRNFSGARLDWSQAKLDGLTLRLGSNDATPDIGIDAFVVEVAAIKARPEELVGSAGDPIHVTVGRDPDTLGLVDMDVTTVGAGATVDYEIEGVPQTQIVVAADDTEHRDIGGTDFQNVNRVDVTPD